MGGKDHCWESDEEGENLGKYKKSIKEQCMLQRGFAKQRRVLMTRVKRDFLHVLKQVCWYLEQLENLSSSYEASIAMTHKCLESEP
jgi:hypothetical protein